MMEEGPRRAEPQGPGDSADTPVKVSVVVPVYNAGSSIEPCIASLLGQSLPAGQCQLIFVDDGSTDTSLTRLRALAAEHEHVVVIPIPNSGWPGKPRNVGTDQAHGEYVMFMDQDDSLEPESLERMYTMASAVSADVVLGKVISDFRGVNQEVYREQRPRCDVFSAPLMESLTPHKMFRRQFLRDSAIRYPEGPRRLEDQLFMAKSYFAAESVTIVADYICYRYLRRPDGGNAGSKRIEPASYYGNLREVLDVVDSHTGPGEQRDRVYARFLRVELMGRLSGAKVLRHPRDFAEELLLEVKALMKERFPMSVEEGMGAAMRVRARLVRRGTLEQLLELAHSYNAVKAQSKLTGMRAGAGGLVMDIEVRLTVRGKPLLLESGGGRLLLPRSVVGDQATDDERQVDDDLGQAHGDVVVRHRALRDEWFVPAPLTVQAESGDRGTQLVWRGTAQLDPATAAGGAPLRAGTHDLYVRVAAFGWNRTHRLGAVRAGGIDVPDLLVDAAGRPCRRYDTDPQGNLSLEVGVKAATVGDLLRASPLMAADRAHLGIRLNGWWAERLVGARLTLRRADGHEVTWSMAPSPDDPRSWQAAADNGTALRPGTYRVTLRLGACPQPVTVDEVLVVPMIGPVRTRSADAGPILNERLTAVVASGRRRIRRT
jgi:glycosyltransferase involved in cell wall biosynthesis